LDAIIYVQSELKVSLKFPLRIKSLLKRMQFCTQHCFKGTDILSPNVRLLHHVKLIHRY